MHSRLRCGCFRASAIYGAKASKLPSQNRNPNSILRKFLATHSTTKPVDFETAEFATFDYLASKFRGIHPYHFNDIKDRLYTNTSPGLYYRNKGFRTKREVMEVKSNAIRYQVHRLKSTSFSLRPKSFVCVVDSTINPETRETKNRVAWVYPLVVTAAEAMFFEGFRRVIVCDPTWVPSPENRHSSFCGGKSRSYDFSSFDSSIPRWLVQTAFTMIRALIDFGTYAPDASGRIGVPYSGTSLEQLFDYIESYFLSTPFVSSTGFEGCANNGVPSGSMFTNLVDTIVSRMLLAYVHGTKCSISTYGDDCHVKCRCSSSPTIEKRALASFGLKLKIDEPNEHGCLTYCKAECHLGEPYHPGSWFAGILLCIPTYLEGLVSYALALTCKPTVSQFLDLRDIVKESGVCMPDRHNGKKLAKLISKGETSEFSEALDMEGPFVCSRL